MAVPIQGILFLGIVPALVLLYISLKHYEGCYKDKGLFLAFVFGILLGFIAAYIRLRINPVPLLIIFIILFAILEQLMKTIILNVGRLQEKKGTMIYGLSLGLGFGTVFTPFLLIAAYSSIEMDTIGVSIITIGTIGIILFHGATGALIGYGIYKNKPFNYLFIAILLQLPFNVILDLSRFYSDRYFIYYQVGLVIFGGLLYWYISTKIMPKILQDDNRKKRKKLKS